MVNAGASRWTLIDIRRFVATWPTESKLDERQRLRRPVGSEAWCPRTTSSWAAMGGRSGRSSSNFHATRGVARNSALRLVDGPDRWLSAWVVARSLLPGGGRFVPPMLQACMCTLPMLGLGLSSARTLLGIGGSCPADVPEVALCRCDVAVIGSSDSRLRLPPRDGGCTGRERPRVRATGAGRRGGVFQPVSRASAGTRRCCQGHAVCRVRDGKGSVKVADTQAAPV
jgi:hypothetical protein